MSNHPKQRPAAKTVAGNRPAGELQFDLVIRPPDGEIDPTEDPPRPHPVQLHVDLRKFSLAERQLVKRALAKFAEPQDFDDVIVVHAWVVWRRTHPTSSLQHWMDHIEWGDVLDGLAVEPGHVEWDTTPEGFDPEA